MTLKAEYDCDKTETFRPNRTQFQREEWSVGHRNIEEGRVTVRVSVS